MTLKFETKILDIAYLLMLKQMKEPTFKFDMKFIQLFLKVLIKTKKQKEALDFIEAKQNFWKDKQERQMLQANLYYQSGNYLLGVNMLFSLLKINSNAQFYKEMPEIYTDVTRIIINNYLPSINYDFLKEPVPNFLTEESFGAPKGEFGSANFEPLTLDQKPTEILEILFYSIRNLRINTNQIDVSQRRLALLSIQMKRASYLAEMEFRYVYALKCPSQPVGEGTSHLNIILEYVENFHDQTDVVEEIRPYLTLLMQTDTKIIFNRIENRLKMIVKLDSEDREAKGKKENVPFIASVKLLRYQFVAFKLFRIIGIYSGLNTV